MSASSATLLYQVTPIGSVTAAALSPLVAAVDISDTVQALHDLFGATLTSDSTSVILGVVNRTIVFAVGAKFNAQFPPGTDQTAPFRHLFTHQIGAAVGTPVATGIPMIA